MNAIDLSTIKSIEQDYQTGDYSRSNLAIKYNISRGSVNSILKNANIKMNRELCGPYRKHKLNVNFFDKIDTEDKAYVLGFLYADGCNQRTRNSIQINLNCRDIEMLEKIKLCMNSSAPITKIKDNTICRISFNGKYICDKLEKLGCMANKTFLLKFPTKNQVPPYLIRHFIRGYFDGDGSFSVYRNKKCNYWKLSLGIVSTLLFCSSLSDLILKELKITSHISKRHKNREDTNRNLIISGNKQIISFLTWLYEDSNIYLKRKYSKFLSIKQSYDYAKTNKSKFIPQQQN